MYFKTADVAGLRLFYREAGDPSKPNIILLHGFPTSSYQFHDLIPLLGDKFHVIAPDYPCMGYSEAPAATALRPTFDDVATVIDAFIAQCAPGPLILYLHDIGGPIGMRIAMAHPERLGSSETPEKLAETEQFATVDRVMTLHKKGRAQPRRPEPGQLGDGRLCVIDRGESRLQVEVVYEPRDQHPALSRMERLSEGPAAKDSHRLGAK
jgi:pimeloyl-ACP methyl ester carboxylesterase